MPYKRDRETYQSILDAMMKLQKRSPKKPIESREDDLSGGTSRSALGKALIEDTLEKLYTPEDETKLRRKYEFEKAIQKANERDFEFEFEHAPESQRKRIQKEWNEYLNKLPKALT